MVYESVCLLRPLAVQKRLNRSRCRLGGRLVRFPAVRAYSLAGLIPRTVQYNRVKRFLCGEMDVVTTNKKLEQTYLSTQANSAFDNRLTLTYDLLRL